MILTTKSGIKMAENKVKPRDNVKVYGTGNSGHIAKGVEITMHKIPAAKLVEKGFVTYEKPESESKAASRGGKKE
jgi:hypothetical protein